MQLQLLLQRHLSKAVPAINLKYVLFKKFILGSKIVWTNELQKASNYSGKMKVPEKALEEIKMSYFHSIVRKIEQHDIPQNLHRVPKIPFQKQAPILIQ